MSSIMSNVEPARSHVLVVHPPDSLAIRLRTNHGARKQLAFAVHRYVIIGSICPTTTPREMFTPACLVQMTRSKLTSLFIALYAQLVFAQLAFGNGVKRD